MTTAKYDRVYYWTGGTERGQWNEAIPGAWPDHQDIDSMIADCRRMGYVAVKGCASIGAPEGSPLTR